MTIRKIFFGTVCLLGTTMTVQAQYTKDVLLFSQGDQGGTARFKAMGNASTALGGDISTITSNPAGLGYFNQSDLSVTGRYLYNKNKTNYFSQNSNSNTDNFNLDNAGLVFHLPTYRDGGNLAQGWLNFNVGIAYNRNNVYNNKLTYRGINPDNSMAHAYADQAALDGIGSGWGQDFYNNSFMLDDDPTNSNDFFPLTRGKADLGADYTGQEQINSIREKGSKSESVLSFGANYSNKFYLGASLGFTSFHYETSNLFTEYGRTLTKTQLQQKSANSAFLKDDLIDPNSNTKYSDFLDADYELFEHYDQVTDGTGIDFKLGMIYKFTPTFSLGFTAKTPTWMNIKDDSDNYTRINYFDPSADKSFYDYVTNDNIGTSSWEYNMITPYRLSLGASQVFSRGLLTADVEWVDYGAIRYRDVNGYNSNQEEAMNESIKNNYQGAFNARIGGELLLNSVFSGRAGFNYSGNPYKNADYENYTASLGIGAKLGRGMYIDLTGAYNAINYKESPYVIDEAHWASSSPVADIKNQRTNLILTIGSKF